MTPKQLKLLLFIAANTVDDVSPTYDQMIAHMGMSSKGNICRLVDALEQDGYVRRVRNASGETRARGIVVLRLPAGDNGLEHYAARIMTAAALYTASRLLSADRAAFRAEVDDVLSQVRYGRMA